MKQIFSFLFILNGLVGFCQTKDTSLYTSENPYRIFQTTINADSLFGFSFLKQNFKTTDLGNPGSKEFNLEYDLPQFEIFGSSFMYSNRHKEFYFCESPVTYAYYSLGSNKTQELYIRHVQKFAERTYTNLIYRKTRSEGFYVHQLNNVDQINFNLVSSSKSKRYELSFQGQYDGVKRQENGGLNDDSLFNLDFYSNPNLYLVQFTDGMSYFRNWYADLIQNLNLIRINEKFRLGLSHQFSYRYNSHEYNGLPTNGFYSSIFKDSLSTIDKSEIEVFSNEIALNLRADSLDLKLGFNNSLQHFYSFDSVNHGTQNNLFLNLNYDRINWKFKSNVQYYLGGVYDGNYFFHTTIKYNRETEFISSYEAKITTYNSRPLINELFYSGNHFQWSNSFLNNQNTTIELKLSHKKKLSLRIKYNLIKHPLYLDTLSQIKQSTTPVSILGAGLEYRVLLFKHLNFYADVFYQNISSGNVIRVPNLILNSSLFYSGKLWTMQFNSGVHFNYYSSYFANSFNPNLNSFYIQDLTKYGNYPMLDVFFEARVKTVKVFFSLNHVMEGLMGSNYFIADNLPMTKRCFRFGLSWNFYN